ncbi:hypothetical protein EMIHUDRAFT_248060 [Emiliania huxleyi CCMP1516]|uniref:Uncharacterized protein n=2 Tax=Emiliania huxleyi TaxID=2903 RepID=A0A0D3II29_EMIH1|nr:hypothetical protein EMIHUDRAFT_215199 [Emiliania huxleyi CCMP1516]XP_005763639.1 hypothetical protein EMIHUDRAFT_248060 [Emiliania huxleyi CCMP1516]EOD10914.1 hypothetical protein EMIHUDRAFT_215199 [Emiliania huxleyi CCMP1516]EOD11210.1 hypothetical protein EMIHUDRAFT_248060 [Emiliania huxleyi CCMP1516]|eukprot:XP_005763343.1 hypothetical protein EMIHUDRAFT_215199 [Emiliania huxleyi CCMP1516]
MAASATALVFESASSCSANGHMPQDWGRRRGSPTGAEGRERAGQGPNVGRLVGGYERHSAYAAPALVEDSADTSSEPAALDADAAANGVGGEARGATLALQAEFEELSRELQELWVANEQRDEDDPERLPLDDLAYT